MKSVQPYFTPWGEKCSSLGAQKLEDGQEAQLWVVRTALGHHMAMKPGPRASLTEEPEDRREQSSTLAFESIAIQ